MIALVNWLAACLAGALVAFVLPTWSQTKEAIDAGVRAFELVPATIMALVAIAVLVIMLWALRYVVNHLTSKHEASLAAQREGHKEAMILVVGAFQVHTTKMSESLDRNTEVSKQMLSEIMRKD